ncbi:hypothetical protein RT97_23300 [Variovorax paradoxus]|uniref:Uncharacterized protein n=1 Tax=Variovorax paradoxus TaxID=34073 RepID=A0A0D0M7Z5_VARPD|nr:hypothetical protein [Variovorax paradoxus]KIQ25695.1 hypothetical protein RT97_23300 [Variovorax paradoxus]
MAEEPNPAEFTAWMAAETAAYTAIHQLHQRTQGGRLAIPDNRIEQIARLRKEADVRFASMWGALGAAPQPSAVAPVKRGHAVHSGHGQRPAFELLSRPAAEPIESRLS